MDVDHLKEEEFNKLKINGKKSALIEKLVLGIGMKRKMRQLIIKIDILIIIFMVLVRKLVI